MPRQVVLGDLRQRLENFEVEPVLIGREPNMRFNRPPADTARAEPVAQHGSEQPLPRADLYTPKLTGMTDYILAFVPKEVAPGSVDVFPKLACCEPAMDQITTRDGVLDRTGYCYRVQARSASRPRRMPGLSQHQKNQSVGR
jgi:hypothetical protein